MDKLLHLTVSALIYLLVAGFLTITGASNILLVIVVCSSLVALGFGIGKEFLDYLRIDGKGHASWMDMLFNVLGTGLGILIHLMF